MKGLGQILPVDQLVKLHNAGSPVQMMLDMDMMDALYALLRADAEMCRSI